tara:strand:+ start:380 stop:973 length:594 start_codon:yes stop_codon:yes gene_type:complete
MQKKKMRASSKPGFVRVISGQWKGRKLPILASEGLRPTTDRVKETLFNWLMSDINQARVLDVCSGSGSLAFEALSRYASYALLCEKQAAVAAQLRHNLDKLGCTQAEVVCEDALDFLARSCDQPFDVVFLDPPFRKNLVQPCLQLLEEKGWIADGTLIYVEQEKEAEALTESLKWKLIKTKTAGQTRFQLWVYQETV